MANAESLESKVPSRFLHIEGENDGFFSDVISSFGDPKASIGIVLTGGGIQGAVQIAYMEELIKHGLLQKDKRILYLTTSIGTCITYYYGCGEHTTADTLENGEYLRVLTREIKERGALRKGWPPFRLNNLREMLTNDPKINLELLSNGDQPLLATVVQVDGTNRGETAYIDLRTARQPVEVVLASSIMPRLFDANAVTLEGERDFFTGETVEGLCVDGGYSKYPVGVIPLLEKTQHQDSQNRLTHLLVLTGIPQGTLLDASIGKVELDAITIGLPYADILRGFHERYNYEWSLLTGGRRRGLSNLYNCRIAVVEPISMYSAFSRNENRITTAYNEARSMFGARVESILNSRNT